MNQDNSVPTSPSMPQAVPVGNAAPAVPPQMTANTAATPWLEPPIPVQPPAQALQKPQPALPTDPQLYVVAPAVADDGDLIEKEWVQGAKQIVERTRMDPHQQVKEMHAFKADYMKKRYNKVIELVEE